MIDRWWEIGNVRLNQITQKNWPDDDSGPPLEFGVLRACRPNKSHKALSIVAETYKYWTITCIAMQWSSSTYSWQRAFNQIGIHFVCVCVWCDWDGDSDDGDDDDYVIIPPAVAAVASDLVTCGVGDTNTRFCSTWQLDRRLLWTKNKIGNKTVEVTSSLVWPKAKLWLDWKPIAKKGDFRLPRLPQVCSPQAHREPLTYRSSISTCFISHAMPIGASTIASQMQLALSLQMKNLFIR